MQTIRFKSDGTWCSGDLFIPTDFVKGTLRPAIVFGRGFSMVKEASLEDAACFVEAGYVVLSIDYRTFGESDGEPRGQLFPLREVDDYRNAITYLQLREEVDPKRIGIWGTSFSGGLVIYTAAIDRRVKAVVSQVPIVSGRRWMQALRTRDQWEELLDRLDADRMVRFQTGSGERIRVSGRGSQGEFCAMPSDAEQVQYLEDAKARVRTWIDTITLESVERVIEFDPESVIDRIGPRPLCVITTAGYDVVHPVDQILEAFGRAREPKRMILLPFNQLDFYRTPGRGVALGHAIDWFDQFIGPADTSRSTSSSATALETRAT